ncbi:lipopolysaccharide biosynthesis protein [soil metagenome]
MQDGLFRAVIRNAGYLVSGKLVGAALGLIALACAGRGLGPAWFGTLMIVHLYATGVGALAKFQTWQFIIRNGTPALQRGEAHVVRDTIRFSTGLDLSSGLIGMAGAMLLLPLLYHWLGLPAAALVPALLYCTLVPTMTAATPTGTLRMFDRFDQIAQQQAVTPALRAAGAALSYFTHAGFGAFVVCWYIADLVGDLVLWGLAARELRRRDMLDAFRPGLFGVARRLPGAWGFVWTTNIAHSLYAAWGPLSNLVVASALGPAAAGLFKIAATLVDSTSKPADLLGRGFYPEIMRLDPASRDPWRLGLRLALLSAGAGVGLVMLVMLGGTPVIGALFGHRYAAASGLLQIMAWSVVISTAAFPLESLLYMVGRQRAALVAQACATLAYIPMLDWITRRNGLAGAGYAVLIGTALNAGLMLLPTVQSYLGRHSYRLPIRMGLAA